jgi:insertion element IS1 protein InsB
VALPGKQEKKLWIFKAIDRATGELLAFVCGDRSLKTVNALYEKLGHLKIGHFYSDCFEAFSSAFPCHQLTQSKKYTHAIERHNCRNRHWVARFNRKTIAFSRSQSMVEATMKLLAYYRFKHPEKLQQLKTLLN